MGNGGRDKKCGEKMCLWSVLKNIRMRSPCTFGEPVGSELQGDLCSALLAKIFGPTAFQMVFNWGQQGRFWARFVDWDGFRGSTGTKTC